MDYAPFAMDRQAKPCCWTAESWAIKTSACRNLAVFCCSIPVVKHNLAFTAYNQRRQEAEDALAELNKHETGLVTLRDATADQANHWLGPRQPAPPQSASCSHEGAAAFELCANGRYWHAGRLVNQSYESRVKSNMKSCEGTWFLQQQAAKCNSIMAQEWWEVALVVSRIHFAHPGKDERDISIIRQISIWKKTCCLIISLYTRPRDWFIMADALELTCLIKEKSPKYGFFRALPLPKLLLWMKRPKDSKTGSGISLAQWHTWKIILIFERILTNWCPEPGLISLMYNYYTPDLPQAMDDDGSKVSMYALGTDYHKVVQKETQKNSNKKKTSNNCRQALRGRVLLILAPVMERDWARRSGLGWVVKTPCWSVLPKVPGFFRWNHFGSWHWIMTCPSKTIVVMCKRCIEACPTQAISAEGYLMDGSKLYIIPHHRTQRWNSQRICAGKWIHGFWLRCLSTSLPLNRFSTPHSEPSFNASPEFLNMGPDDWMRPREASIKYLVILCKRNQDPMASKETSAL